MMTISKHKIILEYSKIYKYTNKTQNKLIPEQIQINTKHDTIFKALNIENTQNTNIYTCLLYTSSRKRLIVHQTNLYSKLKLIKFTTTKVILLFLSLIVSEIIGCKICTFSIFFLFSLRFLTQMTS